MNEDTRIAVTKAEPGYGSENLQLNVFRKGDPNPASSATAITIDTMLCKKPVKTLIIAGVSTRPEYRRHGFVRLIIDRLFEMAPEKGWEVGILHPFSFSYYNKFGYERISDHKIVEFPTAMLNSFDRCSDLVALDETNAQDALRVYKEFSLGKNLLPERNDPAWFLSGRYGKNANAYLWYDALGAPAGYLILSNEKVFEINRSAGVHLDVHEMVYTSPEALYALLGFLRMYEGDNDMIKLRDTAMCPEFEMVYRHFTHMKCRVIPDIAGRILNTEALLLKNTYPRQHGRFRLNVKDGLPQVKGVYEVEYEGEAAAVRRLEDGAEYDIGIPASGLCPIIYGYTPLNSETIHYVRDIEIKGETEAFIRAFPPRAGGVFEHF